MSTTFADLVGQVRSLLHSFSGVSEAMTWLTASATSAATSLTVADAGAVSIGVSEVGEELIYVSASNTSTNVLTLAPFGRGYNGSTAAAHNANDAVTFNPLFPQVEIKRAINQTLAAVYPTLYQIKSTTLTFTGAQATYDLPSDADAVVKVQWEAVGPSRYWPTVSAWEFDPERKTLTFHEPPLTGRTVTISYSAGFTQFASNADTFATAGFPESAVDVLLYGAAAKLVRFLDVARLQVDSVENLSRAQVVASGDPQKVANSFYAMYAQRLQEERARLLELHPPQIHYTR